MSLLNTEYIDKINDQLEGITLYIDGYLSDINTDLTKQEIQKELDNKMKILNDDVSLKLNTIRNKVVEIFKSQYQSALEAIKPIEPILNVDLNIDTVVSVVESIITILTKPYQPIITFTNEIIPKVITLSDNIQKIATYQPNVNIPDVNVPSLNIQVEPITASDITS